MIKVDSDFYERGLTMTGKENRVMLQKDAKTLIEMTFLGNKVELKGFDGDGHECHSGTVYFSGIHSITISNENPSLPAIVLY